MAGPFDRLFTSLYPQLVAWLDSDSEQRIATPTTPLPVTPIEGSGTQLQSTNNSTTTPLAGGGTFLGTADTNVLPEVGCSCYSDQDGTLYFQFKNPGSNLWHTFPTNGFQVSAGIHEFHTAVKLGRSFRVQFVNGSAAQGTFELYTYFGSSFGQGNLPLNQAVSNDSDARIVRTVSDEITIAGQLWTGYSIVNKFGRNPDIDTGTTPEDVWDGGGVYTGWATAAETVTVVSSSANDASAGTGARTITVTGLDANYNQQSETITLNGVTPVAGLLNFIRVHSASVITAGSGGVNAGTITVRQTTTSSNIFMVLQIGLNQSNSSAYTIPAGYTGYVRKMRSTIRGSTSASVEGYIWTRSFGGVFRSRRPFVASFGSDLIDEIFGGLRFTEKSDLIVRISTASANNLDVTGSYDLLLVKNS